MCRYNDTNGPSTSGTRILRADNSKKRWRLPVASACREITATSAECDGSSERQVGLLAAGGALDGLPGCLLQVAVLEVAVLHGPVGALRPAGNGLRGGRVRVAVRREEPLEPCGTRQLYPRRLELRAAGA